MKINKKVIEMARIIRKNAARKYECEEKEIGWAGCVGLALEAETLRVAEIEESDKIRAEKGLDGDELIECLKRHERIRNSRKYLDVVYPSWDVGSTRESEKQRKEIIRKAFAAWRNAAKKN